MDGDLDPIGRCSDLELTGTTFTHSVRVFIFKPLPPLDALRQEGVAGYSWNRRHIEGGRGGGQAAVK